MTRYIRGKYSSIFVVLPNIINASHERIIPRLKVTQLKVTQLKVTQLKVTQLKVTQLRNVFLLTVVMPNNISSSYNEHLLGRINMFTPCHFFI